MGDDGGFPSFVRVRGVAKSARAPDAKIPVILGLSGRGEYSFGGYHWDRLYQLWPGDGKGLADDVDSGAQRYYRIRLPEGKYGMGGDRKRDSRIWLIAVVASLWWLISKCLQNWNISLNGKIG